MKKEICLLCVVTLFFALSIYGGEGNYKQFLRQKKQKTTESAQMNQQLNRGNGSTSEKVKNYKQKAEKVNIPEVEKISAAPNTINRSRERYNILKKKLKNLYNKLAQAYNNQNNKKIGKIKDTIWLTKEKIKVAEKIKNLGNMTLKLFELKQEFPNSERVDKLVNKIRSYISAYKKNADNIITSKRQQRNIRQRLKIMSDKAKIVKQQEVLKKMKENYSKKYGNN